MFKDLNSNSENEPTMLKMAANITTGNTTPASVSTIQGSDGYLFKTLNGYHITIGDLLVSVAIFILGIWIILLNSLLIETLIRCRAQLEVTDIFIHSLATTDAIVGFLLLYNSIYNIVNFQDRHECLIRFGLLQGMLVNSTLHISLLTINRYIKITKTFQYQRIFKKHRIIIVSGTVWCFSILFGFLPLMGWNKEYHHPNEDKSHTVCRYFGVMRPSFIGANLALFWAPLMLMIFTYSHVCRIACRHSREITAQERNVRQRASTTFLDSRSWRFTKTVFIIIGVYFFCWLATGLFFAIQLSGSVDHLNYTDQGNILTITTSLGFLNSLLNPIIYATKIPCVRRRFRKTFCCRNRGVQDTIDTGVVFTTDGAKETYRRSSQMPATPS